jgi:hypothetical protein
MNKNVIGLLLIAIAGSVSLLWGLHGIVNRKKINNRVNYIFSVGQFIGGIMCWIFLICVFIRAIF